MTREFAVVKECRLVKTAAGRLSNSHRQLQCAEPIASASPYFKTNRASDTNLAGNEREQKRGKDTRKSLQSFVMSVRKHVESGGCMTPRRLETMALDETTSCPAGGSTLHFRESWSLPITDENYLHRLDVFGIAGRERELALQPALTGYSRDACSHATNRPG